MRLRHPLLKKNSVLFVGSGFSIGAKNILNQKIVGSYKLRDELLKGIGLSEYDDYTLNDASEKYIDKFGEAQLIDLLKNNFSVSITTDDQNKVCSLPWKRIYTSNYDDVVEMSGKLSSKHYTPITINDDPKFYKDKSKLCIHLNGYINNLTPKTLYSSFKLTDVSYLTTEFVNSEWITLFRSDIQTSDYVFFLDSH